MKILEVINSSCEMTIKKQVPNYLFSVTNIVNSDFLPIILAGLSVG